MKRVTLVALMLFAFVGVPLAAFADHHEGKAKDKSNANSNAQWAEDAKKGQERAAEVKDRAVSEGKQAEADAKSKADQATGDAKSKIDAAVPGMGGAAK